MTLTIRLLTPDLWPALEDLFGKAGASNGCWCMYWRIGSLYRQRPRDQNKSAFRRIVKRGPPAGLLAFDGDKAVGWCQLTPRNDLSWLDRGQALARVDEFCVDVCPCGLQGSRAPKAGCPIMRHDLGRRRIDNK